MALSKEMMLLTFYDELDDTIESRAKTIMIGLGFSIEDFIKPTKFFSGGWRMRISLARALFLTPRLLLLDEPTNHLDLNAIIWLDSYLQTWKTTLIIVSHNQQFLDNVCTNIIAIENKKLVYYKGNYSSFKRMSTCKFNEQLNTWSKTTKGKSKKTKKTTKPQKYGALFQIDSNIPSRILSLGLEDVTFVYEPSKDHSKHLFMNLNFGIDTHSRIAIVGPNGVGKSTLLKLMIGKLYSTSGRICKHPKLQIGYFDQHTENSLDFTKSATKYLIDKYDVKCEEARKLLGTVGLQPHAHTIKMENLSGGQKTRVVLAELMYQQPDLTSLRIIWT